MASLNIQLEPSLLMKLNEFAVSLGFSQNQLAEDAISAYLAELEEDRRDLETAKRISAEIACGKMKTIPAEEVYKELGI